MQRDARLKVSLTLVSLIPGVLFGTPARAGAPFPPPAPTALAAVRATAFQAGEGGYRFSRRDLAGSVGPAGLTLSTPGVAAPFGLRFAGIGRGQDSAAGAVQGSGTEGGDVVIRREGLTEWYRSTPAGLEQGFTVAEPPAGSGPVALRLALSAGACGTLSGDGRSLRFDLGGGRVLHYDGLAAFDATGRELAAGLACADGEVLISVDDSGAVYPLTIDPLIFLETQLTAHDGVAGDRFGLRVALSGDTAIVGAYLDSVDASAEQGSAYVYVRTGGVWSLQARLTAADGEAGDRFASSVAIDGNTAIIGSYHDDIGANPDQGSAYVFVRSAGVWTQQVKLTAGDGEADDAFGVAVAISGDTALVGSRYDDVGANADQGSAYVFFRQGATWSQQGWLTAGDGEPDDAFGISVAISGDTALVGARNDDVGGGPNVDQGSAYVFVRSAGVWALQDQLTSSDGEAGDLFGISVALSGETALVGAMLDDVDIGGGLLADHGSAYVFVRSAGGWNPEAQLIPADGEAGASIGSSLSLSGDFAVIGAPSSDGDGAADQGAAYLFTRSGTTWSQSSRLTAWSGAEYDWFGRAVAVNGSAVLVGADGTDVGPAAEQGSAHVFDLHRDLAVGASASRATPPLGATVYLTASVTNYGSSTDGVSVSAPLPAGLTLVASSTSIGTYAAASGAWSVGSLAPYATATLTLQATVNADAAGKILVFRVARAGKDDNPANDTAAVELAVGPPEVGLAAAASTASAAVGDTVALTATLANLGPLAASGATVSCPLPAGLSLAAATPDRGAYDPGTGIWDLGPAALGVGASAKLVLQATITAAAAGKTVVFAAQTPWADGNPANNTASASISVSPLQLLLNGGMETDANGDRLPDRWTKTGWAAGDGRTTTTRRSGKASLKLSGNGKLKVLQQQIARAGAAGDRLVFSAYGKPAGVPSGAAFRAELAVFDGAAPVLRKTLSFARGTSGFSQRTATVVPSRRYTKIAVKFSYQGVAGSVWLDDASLLLTAP